MMNKLKLVTNGIFKENPVLCLVLGTCPTLAISVSCTSGVGMGIAATFVLICSNMAISMLRKVIPDKVRIPCYITVIAAFVTLVMMLLEAFIPSLYDALGIYLPLIVVNCIILGRAEMFANKNTIADSALDGLGMGLGFTATLLAMATIREVIGSGTWFGLRVISEEYTIKVMTMAPGGFFTFGLLMALLTAVLSAKKGKAVKAPSLDDGCSACPLADSCAKTECAKGEAAE